MYPSFSQVVMFMYALTLTCRRNPLTLKKLYFSPPFLPPSLYAVYMLGCVLLVTWLFTFDSHYLVASMVALLGASLALNICVIFAVQLMWKYEHLIGRQEMWINVVLVQNSLGLFATWVIVAATLNVGIVLRYKEDYSMSTACWVALVILAAIFFCYAIFDMFVATVKLRYQLTPYLVVIVALAGVLSANSDTEVGFIRFAVGVLTAVVLLLMAKITLSVLRAVREPSPLDERAQE